MSNVVSVGGALQSLQLYRLQRCFNLCDEVLDVAIAAIEELKQYRAIGTVERFKYLSQTEHNYENCHNLTCRTRCEKDGYAKGIDDFVETLNRHEQENWIDHMEYGITWSDIELVAKKLKGE